MKLILVEPIPVLIPYAFGPPKPLLSKYSILLLSSTTLFTASSSTIVPFLVSTYLPSFFITRIIFPNALPLTLPLAYPGAVCITSSSVINSTSVSNGVKSDVASAPR